MSDARREAFPNLPRGRHDRAQIAAKLFPKGKQSSLMKERVKWRLKQAAEKAQEQGFAKALSRHVLLHYERSSTLVVSFDNMKSRDAKGQIYPWAYGFVENLGHSHLGVIMQRRCDWFRQPDLEDYFDTLRAKGFFDQFERVIFYGASMGGYGALSYAAAVPGSDVVVFSPQTSLDPNVVPFETRYRDAYARGNWSNPQYGDAMESAKTARRVTVFADPTHRLDAAHVGRLDPANLVFARCPSAGHNPARLMKFMGCLGDVVQKAFDGTLTEQGFSEIWRAHRGTQALARVILRRGIQSGHLDLVFRTLQSLEKSRPDWGFRQIEAELIDTLAKRNVSAAEEIAQRLSA